MRPEGMRPQPKNPIAAAASIINHHQLDPTQHQLHPRLHPVSLSTPQTQLLRPLNHPLLDLTHHGLVLGRNTRARGCNHSRRSVASTTATAPAAESVGCLAPGKYKHP
jgi:hypothetical protein